MIADDDQTAEQAREYMAHAEELAALKFLAIHGDGRKFLRMILGWSGTLGTSPSQYSEGRRSIGLQLLGIMDEVDPMLYPTLCADQAREAVALRVSRVDG